MGTHTQSKCHPVHVQYGIVALALLMVGFAAQMVSAMGS